MKRPLFGPEHQARRETWGSFLDREVAPVYDDWERERRIPRDVYALGPDVFERWSPAGTPQDIAEFVAPYLEAGATRVSLIARGQDFAETIESVAEVRRLVGVTSPA